MKKSLYLLGIILLPFCAISQVKFGVQGGFALSKTDMNNTL